jgi:hypothetical protein
MEETLMFTEVGFDYLLEVYEELHGPIQVYYREIKRDLLLREFAVRGNMQLLTDANDRPKFLFECQFQLDGPAKYQLLWNSSKYTEKIKAIVNLGSAYVEREHA